MYANGSRKYKSNKHIWSIRKAGHMESYFNQQMIHKLTWVSVHTLSQGGKFPITKYFTTKKTPQTNLIIFIWSWGRRFLCISWFLSSTVLSVALGPEWIIYVATFFTLPAPFRCLGFWKVIRFSYILNKMTLIYLESLCTRVFVSVREHKILDFQDLKSTYWILYLIFQPAIVSFYLIKLVVIMLPQSNVNFFLGTFLKRYI